MQVLTANCLEQSNHLRQKHCKKAFLLVGCGCYILSSPSHFLNTNILKYPKRVCDKCNILFFLTQILQFFYSIGHIDSHHRQLYVHATIEVVAAPKVQIGVSNNLMTMSVKDGKVCLHSTLPTA